MKTTSQVLATCAALVLMAAAPSATATFSQGFEADTVDWVAAAGIARTATGFGTLHLTAKSGDFYAELQNLHNGYRAGFGDGGYSFHESSDAVYHGDFYQTIDVYIDADWAPAAVAGDASFRIDMAPYHADPLNLGAEHNFRLTATGTSVVVRVDRQSSPIATLTTTGWYTFMMTFRKAAVATDPVLTDMIVLDSGNSQVGARTVSATSPGGPMASADLRGNGYVAIKVWQNGFANDVLALDNNSTGWTICGPFRDVRRADDISCGADVGGTGHAAINFSGSTKTTGDTWISVYGETPADAAVRATLGGEGSFTALNADVLIHRFNNKKGAGLLALFNEETGKQGLALVIYDNGNTDTLVLGTVGAATGAFTVLKTVPLGAGIAENAWYHLQMDLTVIGSNYSVEGRVSRHIDPTNPESLSGGQVGGTLISTAPLPFGVDASGAVGVVGSAFSATADSSVTNFSIAIP